jgi:vacuolar-type H+-ATPase subunit H
MADQILNAIIQLEAQIEQQLRIEQTKADAWLERVRCEQVTVLSQVRKELVEKNQQLLRQAEQQADRQATVLLEHEMKYCRRLEEIPDQTLLEVLRRQLVKILPRQVDDHQNGKN